MDSYYTLRVYYCNMLCQELFTVSQCGRKQFCQFGEGSSM